MSSHKPTQEDIKNAVWHDKGKGLREREALWFIDFCYNLQPRISLDIGSGWGVTGRILSLTSQIVYSVDIGACGYARKAIAERGRDNVVFIQSPSIDVVPPIPFYSADLCFIDAGHPMLYVIADFMKYSRLVKDGGVICFHDCDRKDVVTALKYIEAQNPKLYRNYRLRKFHEIDITRAYYWETDDGPKNLDINRVEPEKAK